MSDMLADLPDDVRAVLKPHVDAPSDVLAAIGVQIAAKRDEAKAARAAPCGVQCVSVRRKSSGRRVVDRSINARPRWAAAVRMDARR